MDDIIPGTPGKAGSEEKKSSVLSETNSPREAVKQQVQDALKPDIQRTITDLKTHCEQIVTKIKQSMPINHAFKRKQLANEKGALLKNVSTRWNSTLAMIRSYVKNKEALNLLFRESLESGLGLPMLPRSLGSYSNFWKMANSLVTVLSILEDATLHFSKEESSLSESLPYAHSLLRSLENLTNDDNVRGLDRCLEALKTGIQTRSLDRATITHKVATFLNPRFKFLLIDKDDCDDVREKVLDNMTELSDSTEPEHENNCEPEERAIPQNSQEKKTLSSTLDDIVNEHLEGSQTIAPPSTSVTLEQQLASYITEPLAQAPKMQDVLSYWYQHKDQLPMLAKVTLSYLSCPPSSVSSERVFSLAGNIVTKKRCALLPGNINSLAFIKYNHKLF